MKYLIFGLGNPGPKYSESRHNIGFKILDAIALDSGSSFSPARLADISEIKYKSRILKLVKPSTFMNLSGKAVNYYLQNEKVPIENVLVILDDLALPFGTIRIKQKGGDAGHNGLSDIISILGHNKFNRLRFGIGNNFNQGGQVDFVLGDWDLPEQKALPERIKKCVDAVKSFTTIGIERTMNQFNDKYKLENNISE